MKSLFIAIGLFLGMALSAQDSIFWYKDVVRFHESEPIYGDPLIGTSTTVDYLGLVPSPITMEDLHSYIEWCKTDGAETKYKVRVVITPSIIGELPYDVTDTVDVKQVYDRKGVMVQFEEVKIPRVATLEDFLNYIENGTNN